MRFPHAVATLTGVFLVGCGGTSPTPITVETRLLRLEAWAGSRLPVRAAEDDRGISAGKYLLADRPFPAARLDDSTIALAVPADAAAGSYLVRRVAGRDTVALGTIRVYGYLESHLFGQGADQIALPMPRRAPLTAVGIGDQMLRTYDLGAGSMSEHVRVPGRSSLCWSGTEGVVLLRTMIGEPLRPWRLHPVPAQIEGGERLMHPAGAMPGCFWVTPNATMRADGVRPTVLRRQAAWGGWRPSRIERAFDDIEGTVISPRADRATLLASTVPGNVPVYATTSADVTWRIPGVRTTHAAAFSDDGEWLVVAGSGGGGPPRRLLLLQADDGYLVRETMLRSRIIGVRLDPLRPLIYAATSIQGRIGLEVLDRETMRTVASMATPVGVQAQVRDYAVLAFTGDAVIVFDGTRAFRFTLPDDDGVRR